MGAPGKSDVRPLWSVYRCNASVMLALYKFAGQKDVRHASSTSRHHMRTKIHVGSELAKWMDGGMKVSIPACHHNLGWQRGTRVSFLKHLRAARFMKLAVPGGLMVQGRGETANAEERTVR